MVTTNGHDLGGLDCSLVDTGDWALPARYYTLKLGTIPIKFYAILQTNPHNTFHAIPFTPH